MLNNFFQRFRPALGPRHPHRRPVRATRLAAVASALAALTAACADDPSSTTAARDSVFGTPSSPNHIHEIAVDPQDGSVNLATHTGLYRIAEGAARPVGAERYDLMGFAITATGEYLSSGHPAFDDLETPPLLGLMSSGDAGRTWNQESLLAEADFHLLELVGERIYGHDSATGKLQVSDDRTNWATLTVTPLLDLTVNPSDPAMLVGVTDEGLVAYRASTAPPDVAGPADSSAPGGDGQDQFVAIESTAGLGIVMVDWAATDSLVAVTRRGQILQSSDAALTWSVRGQLDGTPQALTTTDEAWYTVTGDDVMKSTDQGRTWSSLLAGTGENP